MVCGQDDDGPLGDTRLLQPSHQIAQCLLQLQVGRVVAADRLGGLHAFDQRVVLLHHVLGAVIGRVSGVGHVVGVEGLAADVFVDGPLHHLQIRGRIAFDHIQSRTDGPEVIAHVGVRLVPVIKGAEIVVIGQRRHSVFRADPAQGKGKEVVRGHLEAHTAEIRHHAHAQAVLAVGGDVGEAAVEIPEYEALIGQSVQRRRQLRVDTVGAEGFGTQHDQITTIEIAGVFVLFGGGKRLEIGVEGGDVLLARFLCGGSHRVQIQCVQHVVCILGVSFSGRVPGDHKVRACAQHGLADIQHLGGQQTVSCRPVIDGGLHLLRACHQAEDSQCRCRQCQRHSLTFQRACPEPKERTDQQRQHHQDQQGQQLPQRRDENAPELGHRIAAHGHEADAQVGAEDLAVDQLHEIDQQDHRRQEPPQPPPRKAGQSGHRGQKSRGRQGK